MRINFKGYELRLPMRRQLLDEQSPALGALPFLRL